MPDPSDPPTLREFIQAWQTNHDALHSFHDSTHRREHEAHNLAISKAETGLTLRLETMNEWRAQLNAERTNFVTREQLEAKLETANARLYTLEKANANLAGRLWAMGAVGGVGLILVGIAVPIALFLVGRT